MRISVRRAKGWIISGLREGPRWLFLAGLIYAPWAYGCTTSETIAILNWLLGIVLTGWIAGMIATRRPPIIPRTLFAIVASLLLLGWWMVYNAHSVYDSVYYLFVPLNHLEVAPGSIDRLLSWAWMIRATTLLGISCFVADLMTRREWLLRIWLGLGIAGGSIALLGLLQKATGAQMIFWGASSTPGGGYPFFVAYYYHVI